MPYGIQPTWRDVQERFFWNLVRLHKPWKWRELNPYVLKGEGDSKPKKRTAWEDVFHSLKNLYVEFRRLNDDKR